MTQKTRQPDPGDETTETLLRAGYEPKAVVAAVEASDLSALRVPEAEVSLRHLSAADALTQLRGARAGGFVALVDAPVGRPVDEIVVDDHAYSGERVGSAWHFTPGALEMACRVAGWSTVECIEPGKLRLS